jgi:hypothetical protein
VRAESRTARKDPAGVRQALEAAVTVGTAIHGGETATRRSGQEAGDHDRAVTQFRAILGYAPNDPIALNNLAYNLAVHQNKAGRGASLRQRAIAVSRHRSSTTRSRGFNIS